jgi:hypothetical protein
MVKGRNKGLLVNEEEMLRFQLPYREYSSGVGRKNFQPVLRLFHVFFSIFSSEHVRICTLACGEAWAHSDTGLRQGYCNSHSGATCLFTSNFRHPESRPDFFVLPLPAQGRLCILTLYDFLSPDFFS